MYTPQNFIDSIAHETHVCKHIFSKAGPAQADYRPAENVRSNLELMRYLTVCASIPVESMLAGDWSGASKSIEEASTMTFEEFPARMDAQLEKVRSLIEGVPAAEFESRDVPLPWGVDVKLGAGLVDASLKFLAAYRLQFFQNVKLSTGKELSTMDAWLGMDKP